MDTIASQITQPFNQTQIKETSKLRVTGICTGTGEFPAQMASNAENVSISWRHHVPAFWHASLPTRTIM